MSVSGGDGPGSDFSHRSQANPSREPIPFSVVRVATATQLPYRKLHGINGLRIATGANCASRKRGSNQWGKSRTEDYQRSTPSAAPVNLLPITVLKCLKIRCGGH